MTRCCTVALACLWLALGFVAPATRAASGAADDAPVPDRSIGSVQRFVEAIASALQQRATTEGFRGGVRLTLQAARGVDAARARAALLPRLKKALRGGPLDAGDGPLRARLAVSEEAGTVWAVVAVEGPGIEGATTVVAETTVDRELLAALGVVGRTTQGRFLLERAGALAVQPGCAPLDAALVDADGDPALELAVLSRCGVEVVHLDDALHAERVAGPWSLPLRRWPRVVLGWLAPVGTPPHHRLWVATSAGHALVVDVRSGSTAPAPAELVPLRGVTTREAPLALRARFGTPVLSLPLRTAAGVDVVVPGLPARMRELVTLPGSDVWVFVAEDGTLAARGYDGDLQPLCPERVGDRVVVVDLDGDGEPELLTSAAVSAGEPDQLVLRRAAPDGSSSTVLLKSPLGGGSIAAIVSGHADFDARPDVIVIEQADDGATATLWRLRHAP
ncbi:MAG: hypothetical protein FJ137_06025 [Deltaproteobacteria bacterium]|nr:hypothetical protein [Deltaproteobacteria bacterium]